MSDTTHAVRRHASEQPGPGQLSVAAATETGSHLTREESTLDLMDQDDDDADDDDGSLDSEEDGLRQLLLLQQTKYSESLLRTVDVTLQ